MGGGGFSWQPYLIGHFGGLLLATGHSAEWRAMQFDHYQRNYLDRDRVFNQDHNPHSLQTVYPSTDPTASLSYCSIPISMRNYYMMIGYHRKKATGELWLTPVIPDEMNHQITNALYMSPEGCGTISAVESDPGFETLEIAFKPDNPVQVTSLYVRDRGFPTTYVNIDGVSQTPVKVGSGHAAELKIDWNNTASAGGITVVVSNQPIGVLDRQTTRSGAGISVSFASGILRLSIAERGMHRIEIVSACGAVVKCSDVSSAGNYRIGLAGLSPGMYFARITGRALSDVRHFVINR
jgi:hypothetical protein